MDLLLDDDLLKNGLDLDLGELDDLLQYRAVMMSSWNLIS
jgi:hypothetical protein